MASVSDTEDGWATLEEIPASSDDYESMKQSSEQSAPDLQSKVDALQEKTDFLQLQSRLKDETIKSLTDRVKLFENFDRQTQEICVNSAQAINFLQTDVSTLKKAMKNMETQSMDCESSTDSLVNSVNRIEVKAKCLEDETFRCFEEQTDCVNTLETNLVDLIDETDERVDLAMDEMGDLRCSVKRIEKDVKDCIDSEKSASVDQFSIDAIQRDVKSLQSQTKASAGSVEALTDRVDVLARNIEHVEYENSESLHRETLRLNIFEDIKKESEDHIEKQTARMDALENYLESRVEAHSERVDRAVTEVKARLDDVLIDKSGLQSQIRLNKGFIRSLTKRVDALETNIERVERENSERLDKHLKKEHELTTAVHDSVQGVEENTKYCFELETDRLKALEDKVERLEQRANVRFDRRQAVAEDQSEVDNTMKCDIETLQNQNKDYKSSIDALTDSVKDMESKAKRFERKADHINAIGSALQNLEKAIKALDAKFERLERQEKDNQCQTRSIMEGFRKSINDCLMQTYTDFSGLAQRVKNLEGSRQKGYTAAMLNQEKRAPNWDAQLYGMQNGAGYGVFVPSYVNGSVRR